MEIKSYTNKISLLSPGIPNINTPYGIARYFYFMTKAEVLGKKKVVCLIRQTALPYSYYDDIIQKFNDEWKDIKFSHQDLFISEIKKEVMNRCNKLVENTTEININDNSSYKNYFNKIDNNELINILLSVGQIVRKKISN